MRADCLFDALSTLLVLFGCVCEFCCRAWLLDCLFVSMALVFCLFIALLFLFWFACSCFGLSLLVCLFVCSFVCLFMYFVHRVCFCLCPLLFSYLVWLFCLVVFVCVLLLVC